MVEEPTLSSLSTVEVRLTGVVRRARGRLAAALAVGLGMVLPSSGADDAPNAAFAVMNDDGTVTVEIRLIEDEHDFESRTRRPGSPTRCVNRLEHLPLSGKP